MEKLENLEKKIGFKFKNKDLLKIALTHSSFVKENPLERLEDNERLEFLGDAVLGFITSDLLYRLLDKPEGDLTIIKTNLVDKKTLYELASRLNLDQYLYLGKGVKLRGETKKYLLANAYEALIGAIYLDKGLKKAIDFLKDKLSSKISTLTEKKEIKNPKNYLQEITQEKFKTLPHYQVIKEEGPPHNRTFSVAVRVNNKNLSVASGKSKKEAEIKAAKKAIKGFLKI